MKSNLSFTVLFAFLLITFSVNAQVTPRVGWWKFDDALDLTKAEIGSAVNISGVQESVEGPATGNKAVNIGLGDFMTVTHGISPNGGGTLVNEYSLQIDFSVPEVGIWHAFFQTDPANSGDADMFTNSSSNAIGTASTTYSSKGISANTWYRMIVSVRNGEFIKVYINGELWLDGADQGIDGRFGLENVLLLFADNDGDDGPIVCSEVGIWDVALEDYEVVALGDAYGERVRDRNKLGWWKFDDPSDMLKAAIGSPLTLTGSQSSVNGPVSNNLATQIGVGSFLSLAHAIVVNEGSTKVNEYSVQIDFSVPEIGVLHSFIQTDPANTEDAELITKETNNTIGSAATGFSSGAISANTWYRMVISVKNGDFFRVYLNGELWLDAPGQDSDGIFGLENSLLLFADNDGGDGIINCSEISLWEVALTDNEVIDLGIDPTNQMPERVGLWKFEDSMDLTKAELGSDLQLTGFASSSVGPALNNNAVFVDPGNYFTMDHGISGNGDGFLVNEYTLQIDFSVPELNIWHAFFQTDDTNGSDADLFINGGSSIPNTIGTSTSGYTSNTIAANTWYRMLVTVKNGVFFRIYMNGEVWLDAAGQAVDGRWALTNLLLMFADNDGEDGTIICSELGIWDVALNAIQAAKLGDVNNAVTGRPEHKISVSKTGMDQNYPNPFSNTTTFPYNLNHEGKVSFRIIDIAGNEIRTINAGSKAPGKYFLDVSSENLKSGIYYLNMISDQGLSTRKMIVIK